MNSPNRVIISIVVIAVVLIVSLIWSLSFLIDARDDAQRAAADSAAVDSIVQRIKTLRPAMATNGTSATLGAQLPGLLDDAMKTSEIDAEDLARISPQPARGIGNGELKEMPVQLVFRQVSLRQVLLFISTLGQTEKRIFLRDLHLSFPIDEATNGANKEWNAELSFSYLSNSPPGPVGTAPVSPD